MYTYKLNKDGSVSVYKDGTWQCFIEHGGLERAKKIFESIAKERIEATETKPELETA